MQFNRQNLWALARLAIAVMIFVAVTAQFSYSSQSAAFSAANFFSYFTILSNIFIAVVFFIEAVVVLRGKQPSLWLECARGAAAMYMIATGVIYALLLSQYPLGLTMPWVNSILHQVAPVAAVIDWLLMPPRQIIPPRWRWSWLLFPLIYAIYTLIRGSMIDWYPYPFLNPNQDGYGRVLAYCVGITVAMLLLAWLVGWTGNYLRSRIKPRKHKR